MTPTSRIVTPPSANAPKTASEARSTVSLSGCFPNLVMWIPRTQMSSAAMRHPFQWFEPEADRLGTLRVDPDDRGCQANLHPNRDVLGVGRDVDHVGPNAGATTVDQRGNVRDRDARRCHRDDGERPHLTGGVHLDVVEANPAAGRAGVPPVEEPGRAGVALVRHQVGRRPQPQVVDEGDLLGHAPPRIISAGPLCLSPGPPALRWLGEPTAGRCPTPTRMGSSRLPYAVARGARRSAPPGPLSRSDARVPSQRE